MEISKIKHFPICANIKMFENIYNSLSGLEKFEFITSQYVRSQESEDLYPNNLEPYLKDVIKYKPLSVHDEIHNYGNNSRYVIAYRAANENNKIRYSYSTSKEFVKSYGYGVYKFNFNIYTVMIPKENIFNIVQSKTISTLHRQVEEIILHDTRNVKIIECEPFIESIGVSKKMQLERISISLFKNSCFGRVYEDLLKLIDDRLFHNPRGIHGVDHTKRVLFLSLMIASHLNEFNKFNQNMIYSIGYAAIYHDIGRSNDYVDLSHGSKSWDKVQELNLLQNKKLNYKEIQFIKEAIIGHSKPDESIHSNNIIYKVLKDADGLDRIRINDFNSKFLRLDVSRSLIDISSYIYFNKYVIN